MSFITNGFGATAALVLTLGFGTAAEPQSGSYVTLGYGESASRTTMLGLSPPVGTPGSYITFGTGQSASLHLRLGMGIGEETEPPPEPPQDIITGNPGRRFQFPTGANRILRDDDEILAFIMSVINSGMLD